jgi:hypothetical protein
MRQLAEVLTPVDWFEGGRCADASPPPGPAATPKSVELVLRDAGEGGLRPGDLRTHRVLRLVALDVREWSHEGTSYVHLPDHLISDLDPVEERRGFGFTVDVPSRIRLIARSFDAERLPDVVEAFGAWASDRELFVAVPSGELPAPRAWVEAIAAAGGDVGWRTYAGDIAPPDRVPPDDYDGWFLAPPALVAARPDGVQVVLHRGQAGLTIKLERSSADEVDSACWSAVCRAAAALVPAGEFMSGNCRFSADEWRSHLAAAAASTDPGMAGSIAIRWSHLRHAHPMEVPRGSDPTQWRIRG